MATASTGWYCACSASVTSSTDTTATITVYCYWQNNGWRYDINNVSAWVYCNGKSYKVKDAGSIDADSSNTQKVSCGSYSFTISKTTSAQTISCYAKITSNSSYVSGTKTSSTVSVSVAKKTSYTVKYNANGGSGAPSSQTKWYGTALTLSSTKPTRTGYTFKGWGTSSSDTTVDYAAGASYTANAAITLYAIWTANTYTVKYNANGGSGAPSSQTKTYGVALTLSSTKPTRTNYTFKGWGTSSSATTVAYAAGASYTNNVSVTLYAIWTLAYTKPKISGFSVTRCNSSGTAADDGTYALVKFSWSTTNTVSSIKIQWKLSSASSYSNSATVSASGTSGSVSQIVGSGALDTESTYDFYITVTDSGGSTPKTATLNGYSFVIDLLSGGKGVAFGKPAELADVQDSAFEVYLRKNLTFKKNATVIYGTKPDGTVCEAFVPQNSDGNVIIGYGNYKAASGDTNIYGNDVKLYSAAAGNASAIPYYKKGDSFSYNIRTAGYVTNGCTEVHFSVPVNRIILGSSLTLTAASVSGFVLRQDSLYTHGSGASSFVTPSSYKAYLYANYIFIVATFSTTTNAVNNAPIGIQWNGTITIS